ncbi:hypothetical protein [Microbacterium sulfonylureivorans]|uniref:hypothetical protein n=1 Tax=Microbacterium sulfonylureivorans TaxID=2486854 RepID=UPI000FDA2D4B|nr:hypothetical protein [Microbacterium sulfonylureivorans]
MRCRCCAPQRSPTASDRFPYPFLDFETLGAAGLVIALLRLVGIILVLAMVVAAGDRAAAWGARRVRNRDVDKSEGPDSIADTVVA